jgi:hypothetical protein
MGFFFVSSKVQRLSSKSSMEAVILAVSDEMDIPSSLQISLAPQLMFMEQDNQSSMTLLNKGRTTTEISLLALQLEFQLAFKTFR